MTLLSLVSEFRSRRGDAPIPGVETREQIAERALAPPLELVAQEPAAPMVVVAHDGVIRSLLAHASDGALPRPGERTENGSVTLLRMTGTGIILASADPDLAGN